MTNLPTAIMSEEDDPHTVVGYMDLTDFQCELGAACGGNRVYPSVEDLKENRKCWEWCGIVEVAVTIKRVVVEPEDEFREQSA